MKINQAQEAKVGVPTPSSSHSLTRIILVNNISSSHFLESCGSSTAFILNQLGLLDFGLITIIGSNYNYYGHQSQLCRALSALLSLVFTFEWLYGISNSLKSSPDLGTGVSYLLQLSLGLPHLLLFFLISAISISVPHESISEYFGSSKVLDLGMSHKSAAMA